MPVITAFRLTELELKLDCKMISRNLSETENELYN